MTPIARRRLLVTLACLSAGLLIAALYAYHVYRTSAPLVYSGPDAPVAGPLPRGGVPRFALVLSGGGYRGFAHIGVLKVLDQEQMKPDLVVGTSVGAVIGSLYAAGLAATDIEQRALAFDLASVRDVTLSRYGELTGESFQRFVNDALGARPIETLQIPFAAVATNLSIGIPAVFTRGNTGAAVRASASIAGTFVPLVIDNALYADGDLVSPLPVKAAKRLGAKRVIAVDVSADPATAPFDDIPINWAFEGATRRALIAAEAPESDLVMRPALPYYAPRTRAYKELAIARGEAAARDVLPTLRAIWAESQRESR